VIGVPRELACRKCRALNSGRKCSVCGSGDLTENWSGIVIVLSVESSEIAKKLEVENPGRYALEIR
jgi:DNA-directed RNA polymerase subunit E"